MFTNRVRLIVIVLFVLMTVFFVVQHMYELAFVPLILGGSLLWGYFKEGPIILAAKQFHIKDYDRAEGLLRQIRRPEWLSDKRRGFYEFMLGGIALHRHDYLVADQHYEMSTHYPMRSVNDHVAALVHIVNIGIRQGDWDRAEAYLKLAKNKENSANAKMRAIIEQLQHELEKNRK